MSVTAAVAAGVDGKSPRLDLRAHFGAGYRVGRAQTDGREVAEVEA